jgi:hypothetical protein
MAQSNRAGILDAATVGFAVATRLLHFLVEKKIMSPEEAIAILDELIVAQRVHAGVVQLLELAKKRYLPDRSARSH